jgi:signal transduction histidine kinase
MFTYDHRVEDLFSSRRFHEYSPSDMAEAAALVRAESPWLQWIFPATHTTRDFVTGQFPALQLSYVIAVSLIYVTAVVDGFVGSGLLKLWLAESVASFATRWTMCAYVTRLSPVEVAKHPLVRLLPLFAIVLAVLHWTWTAAIFIGPALAPTTLVVLLSFVMLSVSIIGIAPASPAICIAYLVPIWVVTAYLLLHTSWASGGTFVVLLTALAAVLWSAFYIVVSGVRKNLVRGDEVDLLVAKLRERNAEVEGLRNAAAKTLATRSTFFASASHDFRQRVHAMKLLAYSAQVDTAAHGNEKSPLARLGEVVEDLETYMTDVLEFARLDSASLNAERRNTRLQDIFQRIDVQFEDVATERNVDLRIRATPATVCTVPAMLVRILENLVSNAIKFTRGRVLVSARRYGGDLRIEVRDRGIGIAPACVDKVFDAFYQAHDAAGGPSDGVGLGLAIVKRLAEALGYRVEVISQLGRGTLMRVIIPSADLVR